MTPEKEDNPRREVYEPAKECSPLNDPIARSDDGGVCNDTRDDRCRMCCSDQQQRRHCQRISRQGDFAFVIEEPSDFPVNCHVAPNERCYAYLADGEGKGGSHVEIGFPIGRASITSASMPSIASV